MALAENLAAAKDAVARVKALNLLASNRHSDRLAEAGGIDSMINSNMTIGDWNQGQLAHDVSGLRGSNAGPQLVMNSTGTPVGNALGPFEVLSVTDVLGNVSSIVGARRGNCMEQAELAFAWIYTHHPSARPLDLMYFRNTGAGYDHVRVRVGIGLSPGWHTVSPIKPSFLLQIQVSY